MTAVKDKTCPDLHHDTYSRTTFGFWVYLLTDFMLFACLFASYAVLHKNTFGGPPAKEILSLGSATWQTYLFLLSTFAISLTGAYAHRRKKGASIVTIGISLIFTALFLWLQFSEYSQLLASGNSWTRSAFLSALFTLLGTHTLHILIGMIWMILLLISIAMDGITAMSLRRVACTKMFWQFLNIIWVFIYTIVYLVEVIQ